MLGKQWALDKTYQCLLSAYYMPNIETSILHASFQCYIIIVPILWMKDWVCSRIDNYVEVTEPVNDRVRIQTTSVSLQVLECHDEAHNRLLMSWFLMGSPPLRQVGRHRVLHLPSAASFTNFTSFLQTANLFHKLHPHPCLEALNFDFPSILQAWRNCGNQLVSQAQPPEHLLVGACQQCLSESPGSHVMHTLIHESSMHSRDAGIDPPEDTSSGWNTYFLAHHLDRV